MYNSRTGFPPKPMHTPRGSMRGQQWPTAHRSQGPQDGLHRPPVPPAPFSRPPPPFARPRAVVNRLPHGPPLRPGSPSGDKPYSPSICISSLPPTRPSLDTPPLHQQPTPAIWSRPPPPCNFSQTNVGQLQPGIRVDMSVPPPPIMGQNVLSQLKPPSDTSIQLAQTNPCSTEAVNLSSGGTSQSSLPHMAPPTNHLDHAFQKLAPEPPMRNLTLHSTMHHSMPVSHSNNIHSLDRQKNTHGQVPPSPLQNTPNLNWHQHVPVASPLDKTETICTKEQEVNTAIEGVTDPETEADKAWLDQWLSKKLDGRVKKSGRKKDQAIVFSIPRARKLLKEAVLSCHLLNQVNSLKALPGDTSQSEAQEVQLQVDNAKKRLIEVQSELNEDAICQLRCKLQRRQRKRARLVRQKETIKEEEKRKEEKRLLLHQQLDQWQNSLQETEMQKKREAEMRKVADAALSDVRRKVLDVKKWQDLLAGLTKLRQVRKDFYQRKGIATPPESDDRFSVRLERLNELIASQRYIYEREERTLRVMLEAEHEETLEREQQQRQQQKAHNNQQRMLRLTKRLLFGPTKQVDEEDPLHSIQQFYNSASHDLQAFLSIRQVWDSFCVPESAGGSSLPVGWIQPSQPSSQAWSSTLRDNQSAS